MTDATATVQALAEHMRRHGFTSRYVETHTGLPATVLDVGLETGDFSLAAYLIAAYAVGLDVVLRERAPDGPDGRHAAR